MVKLHCSANTWSLGKGIGFMLHTFLVQPTSAKVGVITASQVSFSVFISFSVRLCGVVRRIQSAIWPWTATLYLYIYNYISICKMRWFDFNQHSDVRQLYSDPRGARPYFVYTGHFLGGKTHGFTTLIWKKRTFFAKACKLFPDSTSRWLGTVLSLALVIDDGERARK